MTGSGSKNELNQHHQTDHGFSDASNHKEQQHVQPSYPAVGDYLLLWIAPDFGFRSGQAEMAHLLAAHGVEVWQSDIDEALFLPRGSVGMCALDGKYVAELIERAHAATGKRIALVSSYYGAIPALRGAPHVDAYFSQLPVKLKPILRLLNATPTLLEAVPLPEVDVESTKGLDTELQPFPGRTGSVG